MGRNKKMFSLQLRQVKYMKFKNLPKFKNKDFKELRLVSLRKHLLLVLIVSLEYFSKKKTYKQIQISRIVV